MCVRLRACTCHSDCMCASWGSSLKKKGLLLVVKPNLYEFFSLQAVCRSQILAFLVSQCSHQTSKRSLCSHKARFHLTLHWASLTVDLRYTLHVTAWNTENVLDLFKDDRAQPHVSITLTERHNHAVCLCWPFMSELAQFALGNVVLRNIKRDEVGVCSSERRIQ